MNQDSDGLVEDLEEFQTTESKRKNSLIKVRKNAFSWKWCSKGGTDEIKLIRN